MQKVKKSLAWELGNISPRIGMKFSGKWSPAFLKIYSNASSIISKSGSLYSNLKLKDKLLWTNNQLHIIPIYKVCMFCNCTRAESNEKNIQHRHFFSEIYIIYLTLSRDNILIKSLYYLRCLQSYPLKYSGFFFVFFVFFLSFINISSIFISIDFKIIFLKLA